MQVIHCPTSARRLVGLEPPPPKKKKRKISATKGRCNGDVGLQPHPSMEYYGYTHHKSQFAQLVQPTFLSFGGHFLCSYGQTNSDLGTFHGLRFCQRLNFKLQTMLFVENPFPRSLEIPPKCHGFKYIVGDEATYLGPCNGGVSC